MPAPYEGHWRPPGGRWRLSPDPPQGAAETVENPRFLWREGLVLWTNLWDQKFVGIVSANPLRGVFADP